MKIQSFTKVSTFPQSVEALWDFHVAPGAFERLTPPGEPVRLEREVEIVEGEEAHIRVGRWPLRLLWLARYRDVVPGQEFTDVQIKGPFAFWEHRHWMRPCPDGSVLEDQIRYALPLGALGRLGGGRFVRRKLERLFVFRHEVTRRALAEREVGSSLSPEEHRDE